MKKNNQIICLLAAVCLSMMMMCPLMAQGQSKNKKLSKKELKSKVDELEKRIKELEKTIALYEQETPVSNVATGVQGMSPLNNKLCEEQRIQDSLKNSQIINDLKNIYAKEDIFLYRAADALLFRGYNSNFGDYIDKLLLVPDSLKYNWSYGMWEELKEMIMASKIDSVELKAKALKIIGDLPPEIINLEDKKVIMEVLRHTEKNKYSPVQHALAVFNAFPKDSITHIQERDWNIMKGLLGKYNDYNQQICKVLKDISEQSKSSNNYDSFKSKIESTKYYKEAYCPWGPRELWNRPTIPYLNVVIDEALQRIEDAKKGERLKLQDLIKLLE